jgi:uncharacterized protein YdcH (DUF465 family)
MDEPVREQLASADPDFRRLAEEHSQYEGRLKALLSKPYLSDDEQLEEVTLKKQKLRLKDLMEARSHSWQSRVMTT